MNKGQGRRGVAGGGTAEISSLAGGSGRGVGGGVRVFVGDEVGTAVGEGVGEWETCGCLGMVVGGGVEVGTAVWVGVGVRAGM